MATFADFSLVGLLGPVFMFLFVFVVVYGILNKIKFFKDLAWANGVNAIIALVTAFFAVGTPFIFQFLSNIAPWFTVIIILLFMIFFVFTMFAGPETDLFESVVRKPAITWTLMVIFIIIIIASFANTFGQNLLEDQVGEQTVVEDEQNREGQIVIEGNTNTNTNNGGVPQRTSEPGTTASGDFGNNVLQTIVNPKVLGMILFMLISFFTILLLARNTIDPDS